MDGRIEMLERVVEKIAERLDTLERDVAVIKSNYATRADIWDARNSILMWLVSAVLLAQVMPALLKNCGV